MLIAGSYLTSHVLHAILHAHKPLVIRCSLGRNFFHSLKRCSLGISYSVTQCFCKHPSVIYVTWPVMTNYDLQALNRRENSGHFNLKAQFPFNREVLYKQDFKNKKIGRPVILDMDMSPGDIVSLIYLLKAPIEVINLKV